MSSTANINPLQIFQAFMEGTDPSCASVTLPVRDNKNNVSMETAHLTFTDIKNIEPCLWQGSTNPITGSSRGNCAALTFQNGTCNGCVKEGFQNDKALLDNQESMDDCNKKIRIILQISLAILTLYILFRVLHKKK
jgi:hypothetical protein